MEIETLIPIIICIVTVGSLVALLFQIKSQNRDMLRQIEVKNKQLEQSVNNQYDETLRKSMDDLYQVYRTDVKVQTKDECELFATRILDILAVLAHLNIKKKIDDDILEFIKFDLEIAKGIMKWYDEEELGKKYDPSESAKIWSNLTIYFEKHQVKVCKDDALPDCIQNYKNLK